jgi:hypothetical protein
MELYCKGIGSNAASQQAIVPNFDCEFGVIKGESGGLCQDVGMG